MKRFIVVDVPKISLITGIFTMTSYSLKVGIKTFRLMLNAFEGSMERTHPNQS
ncbi:MAG: hypothetical protein MUP85_01015 [Candidatus Lokiarchaeota archaeon]|nr:hypothetical protein [Candidatus Lokiarchaeota archaeon]